MMAGLTLEGWGARTPGEREAIARRVGRGLPGGFAFRGIRTYRLGERRHDVAEFDGDGSRFVLVPGGPATIGYDADRPWEPTPEELESWEGSVEEYGFDRDIREQVAAVTLRPRAVEIPSLLVETEARELGWEPVPADDPEVCEAIADLARTEKHFPSRRPTRQI